VKPNFCKTHQFNNKTNLHDEKKNTPRVYPILSEASQEFLNQKSTIPGFIEFKQDFSPSLSEVSSLLNTFTKNAFELKEVKRETDQLGFIHIKFQQVANSIPFELNYVSVHLINGKVKSLNGNLISQFPSVVTVVTPEKSALQSALQSVNAQTYKWDIPEEELFIKEDTQDSTATFYPKGELVYLQTKNETVLAYKFNIYANQPVSRADYYVDASMGKVIFKNDFIHHADAVGTANTGYSGTRSIVTDSTSPSNFRLRESGRGNGIETFDMNTGTTYGSAVDFTDNNNVWTSTTNDDQYALDAHWGAEMTYDYFWNVHGRNSIDGLGFKLISYIHYDNNYINAFWDGNRMTYGDGNGTSITALTTMAIAGHEISHGLTSNTANLVYSNESGALNESFSDIFGVAIDFWARPSQADWEMGDEIYTSGTNYFRSMSNPNAKGDPDTYLGTNYYTGTADNGGVHTNSGVQNFWFYLLVNGGTGTNDNGDSYSVSPLGLDTAARIAFRNLTVYLGRNSQYSDARFYAIKAATDLYGACSPAVIATTNAWHAVGVGPAYVAGVASNFATLDSIGCKFPHTVSFTNQSNNASTYFWNFGDGNTSTSSSPTHTYTSGPGPFTVTLLADGGTCGRDTLIKIGNVTIDTALPCPTILARNTAMSTINCSGRLIDDGGATGNYSANQVSTFTISPTGATNILLNFNVFDVEVGSGGTNCNYDYLEVYEGTSATGLLIGRYCNNNLPPASITSSSSSLFLRFRVDAGLEESGFDIDWNCLYTYPAPVASFVATPNLVCHNEQITIANTSSSATSYNWTMIGSNISASVIANPSLSYATDGTYTIRLIATNPGGSDTAFQTINVRGTCLPSGGTAGPLTECYGKILDDGSHTEDYSPNQTTYVTIAPPSAMNITLTFNLFDVEADNCIYDYMTIYDGPNTTSPLIGKYCNSSLPPSSLTSSGSSLTIKFYADGGLELDGFDIDWHCSLVGLSESDKINSLKIYPNPSNNYVIIEVNFNQQSESKIVIMDLLGKVLYENQNKEKSLQFTDKIDVSNFAAGTYLIYLNGQANKFVKQ
jgi:Zn-dependent metalloprotease